MKQFRIVFGFELKSLIFKRSIIVTTAVLALLVLGITFVPRFLDLNSTPDDTVNPGTPPTTQLGFDSSYGLVFLDKSVELEVSDYKFEARVYNDDASLTEAIEKEEIETGVVFKSLTNYTVYINGQSMMNAGYNTTVREVVTKIAFESNLDKYGINPDNVYDAQNIVITSSLVALGKDATQGIGFVYIFIIMTYMLILLYGTSVSNSVAREKDSRTMELLITSTEPKTLIIGKVLSAGLVGLLQFAIMGVSAVIGIMINQAYIPQGLLSMIGGNLDAVTLLVFVLFSILGYVLYLFIYAALGSLVSKVEDVSSAVTPITFLFMIAYFVAMAAFNMPDMAYVKISSFIPFTSLFTMPIRYMLTSVSPVELILSLGITVVTMILLAAASIYIYRFGSLNYGNKLKLKDVFKSWRRGDK